MQGASCLLRRCWTAGRLRLAGNRLLCRGGSWPCRPVGVAEGRGGPETGGEESRTQRREGRGGRLIGAAGAGSGAVTDED